MELKDIIIFVAGALTGAGATYLGLKKHFENKANEEIESVKRAFTERVNEIEDEKNGVADLAEKALKGKIQYSEQTKESEIVSKNSSAVKGIIKESNNEDRVDYGEYFPKNSPEALKYDGHPMEYDDSDEPVETMPGRIEDEYGEVVQRFKDGKLRIKLISGDDFGSIMGYDYKELFFYAGDQILVDDEERVIDNPETLIGDSLTKFGFAHNDEDMIYVRNDYLSCDFSIKKLLSSYAD